LTALIPALETHLSVRGGAAGSLASAAALVNDLARIVPDVEEV